MVSNMDVRTGGLVASVDAVDVARDLGVDPAVGLTDDEARSRLGSMGPNRLAAGKKEPAWRAFVRQYEDFMQLVLLGAAAVNQVVTGETGTTVVLAGLTVFNAVVGPAAGVEGRGERQGAVPDDEDDRAGASRTAGGRDRRREPGSRRCRAGRGRQPGACRRSGDPGRDAGDRRGGAASGPRPRRR